MQIEKIKIEAYMTGKKDGRGGESYGARLETYHKVLLLLHLTAGLETYLLSLSFLIPPPYIWKNVLKSDYWAFQLSQVKEYMRYRKLPLRIRLKVEDYYEHRFHHKLFDEDMILSELSKALRVVNIHWLFTKKLPD